MTDGNVERYRVRDDIANVVRVLQRLKRHCRHRAIRQSVSPSATSAEKRMAMSHLRRLFRPSEQDRPSCLHTADTDHKLPSQDTQIGRQYRIGHTRERTRVESSAALPLHKAAPPQIGAHQVNHTESGSELALAEHAVICYLRDCKRPWQRETRCPESPACVCAPRNDR